MKDKKVTEILLEKFVNELAYYNLHSKINYKDKYVTVVIDIGLKRKLGFEFDLNEVINIFNKNLIEKVVLQIEKVRELKLLLKNYEFYKRTKRIKGSRMSIRAKIVNEENKLRKMVR